jgi:hypothetical protein
MLSSAADALAPVGPFRPNDGVSTKPGQLQGLFVGGVKLPLALAEL